jgi:arginine decarboxylase
VHIGLSEDREAAIETIIKGDTVRDVLNYVQFSQREVLHRIQTAVETAVRRELVDHSEAGNILRFYEDGLRAYTYLEEAVTSQDVTVSEEFTVPSVTG